MVLPGPGDYTLRWAGADGQQHAVSVQVTGPPAAAAPATPAPAPAAPAPLRSGVRTTEFWLTAATAATPLVALASNNARTASFAAVGSAAVGIVYTVSRSQAKLAALSAGAGDGTLPDTRRASVLDDASGTLTRFQALRQWRSPR